MAQLQPRPRQFNELAYGDSADFFALLAERSLGETRDGKPYFTCRFRDAKRVATLMVWADSPWFEACDASWRPGQFFKIRGTFGEHERYGPQIEVLQIRAVIDGDRADGFDPANFVDKSRFDPELMFAELRELVQTTVQDPPFSKLVLTILDRHAEPFKRLPARERHFYPFYGGLLEHILSVTRSCLQLADKYIAHYPALKPPLNRDLIVAGAVLHDIGRVLEFEDNFVGVQPTIPGRLFGHLFLGRDLVRDTARELGDVNPELVQLLEHLIITHLTLPEWGSPRLPMIPECLILHHADDLDAKMEMYARCLTRDTAEGPFTARDPQLGKSLLKGRNV